MKRRSTVAAILLLVIFGIATFSFLRHRRNVARSIQKERSYALVVDAYARELRPGMTREGVKNYLSSRGTPYMSRHIGPVTDDLIRIAREPSNRWYCNWLDVNVQIQYSPSLEHSSEPQPDDRLRDIKLDRSLQECL